MQVNRVDYANTYKGKGDCTRVIKGSLQDNAEALLNIRFNESGGMNRVECIIHDGKGHVKGGKGMQKPQITISEVIPMIKDLNARAKEGMDFLKEFLNATKA